MSAVGAAAAVGAVVWITSASAITTAQSFTLVARATEQKNVDLKPRGPSLGDRFVFSGPLKNSGGVDRGRIDGFCTVTAIVGGPEEVRQQCVVTSTIGTANGETEIQATGVGRVQAEDVILSVTGGSSRFQNVRGQAIVAFTGPNEVTITYELIP